ncbi:MAG TPA: branched-chain amino acid transporter permease [Candidatus Eubacterium avistercoris]|uniref:Branched-chain amino acid transporter permease n=1 Tax=Candidatus Eubacterium avistercoris TaxID=2838567 RepID=A0A9D2IFG7_9FIRM|nr:branched-chain amino acid transporter permease [Candidatus Eubacterium avistercoris]
MPLSPGQSLVIIIVTALVTFSTRVIPFLLFPEGRKIPKVVQYLGKVLPPAVIGMLIIYCYKNVSFLSAPFGVPEVLCGALVVVLYIWKRNNLLSIGAGTVLYMVLVQTVFS